MRQDKRKNIFFIILNILIFSIILTACGEQDTVFEKGTRQDETASAQISEEAFPDMSGEMPDEEAQEDIQRPSVTYSCPVQELNSYLHGYESDSPYFYADIVIDGYTAERSGDYLDRVFSFTGGAEVTWHFYNSLEQMVEELRVREENAIEEQMSDASGSETFRLLYYAFPLPEDAHMLDIYQTLKERYDSEEEPLLAIGNGKFFSFTQYKITENGYTAYTAINLVINNRFVSGLVPKSVPGTCSDNELNLFLWDYLLSFGKDTYSGWGLHEEKLYWFDHEERITVMEDPDRSFVEVRGIDRTWEDITGIKGAMGYFGILKEADYEVQLVEDGPELEIHFVFTEDLDETEYETSLVQGYCEDEDYNMTVTDKESGRILQEDTVELCIELPDTITFEDLNADGYLDMFIDKPLHSNDSRAVADKQNYRYVPVYMLWNPQEEQFERKTEAEVENSLLANQNGLTEAEQDEKTKRERPDIFAPLTQLPEGADPEDYIELTGEGSTVYVVQSGDCLWDISERFLGSGYDWTTLQRGENAPEDPDYLLPGEIVRIPEKVYIRKDPYSRGGLRSEGSFQIEMPDGFEYYFLAEGVLFNRWSDENTINCLPITNEMEENALSEDWEAFQTEVIRCSEEICPGKVSNLQFEKYAVKGGCDLYGYSFEYDAGDEVIEYTHFIRLGAANMTEVIGVRKKEPNTVLLNTTRYIAASFIDYGGEPTMGWGREMGPNVGAADWNYPLLHNLFAAAKGEFEANM